MTSETINPSGVFDAHDMADIANLVPEGAEPGTPVDFVPADDSAPAPAPAPAASAPAPAPAPAATPAPTPAPSPAPAPAAAAAPGPAAPAAAPAADDPNKGNLRQALRAARHSERELRDQLAAREKELEDLRAKQGNGAGPGESTDPLAISDAELEELRENYPLQAALVVKAREQDAELQRLRAASPASAPANFRPPQFTPEVQLIVDEVPDLLAWQHDPAAQDRLKTAIAYDGSLLKDPEWASKPDVERFREAARRAAAFHGAAAPAPAPAVDPRAAAQAKIDGLPTQQPTTIGDLRGGASPNGLPPRNFAGMSDEQIMSSLPVQD